MKLCLINIYPSDTLGRYLLSSYILKAYLVERFSEHSGLHIDVFNFDENSPSEKIRDAIIGYGPDFVGYSCYIWNIEKVIQTITGLRDKIHCIHILGGPEISLKRASFFLKHGIGDYCVIGEGEGKIFNLIRYLKEGNGNSGPYFPKGVAHRNGSDVYYDEDKSALNLSEIPSIYLSGAIENRLYERQQAFLETQRGCRNRCKYCVYHKGLPTISYYPLQRIISELDHLIIEKQVFAVRIFDAVFTSNLNRAKEIVRHLCEIKEKKGVRLPWIYWEFVYSAVDEEFIELSASLKYRQRICNVNEISPLDRPQHYSDLLRDYTVVNCVGIQSFCRDALKAVNRAPVNLKMFARFMRLVSRHNIVLKMDLILGLPLETFQSFFDGLDFFLPYFKDTDHILNIHRLQILPGSNLESLCEEYKITYWKKAPHTVFSTGTLSKSEMIRASKLTAILFRVLNSPLRGRLFAANERTGTSFMVILETLLNGIAASTKLRTSCLIKGDIVDDVYWNNEIYREIPSEWIRNFLDGI